MRFYLSSFKLGKDIQVLKKWLEHNDRKILLIPNARDAKADTAEEREKRLLNKVMLEELGLEVKVLDLKDYFNNSEKLLEDVKGYNSCCVIGGNVFVLRLAMKLSGFDNYLKEQKDNDNYLYVAYSAGCCVLAPTLKGYDLVDEPINPYNDNSVIYEGLGLVEYSIAPHYKSNHKESAFIENVVKYFEEENIDYRALRDGEVIIRNME